MGKLTTIILTRGNSEKFADCYKSVKKVSDEIFILVDSKDTSEFKKYKAKVIKHKLNNNFAAHRNFIINKVKTDWLFFIDDDERLTEFLKEKIKNIVNAEIAESAYAIPRKNIIFGREFKHCGQWPDYVIRLFKTKNLKGYEGEVHEQPKFKGDLVHLNEALIHLKHDELSSMVEKTNNWSEIEGRLMFEANHPPMNIFRFLTAMFREFWLRMIKQKAFLDGKEGIIYAIYQVFSRFISYAKLWEMQMKSK